jgi:hypothetical protein
MLPAHLGRGLTFALLVIALVLAGCASQQTAVDATPVPAEDGDGGGDAAAGPTSDLCSILSSDDVAEIAGGEVTDTTDNGTDCDYTIGEGDLVNVRYESGFDPNLETARLICDDAEEVSGIGDEALWCPNIDVLYFNKDNQSLAVQLVMILSDPAREPKEIAQDIARRIADGL